MRLFLTFENLPAGVGFGAFSGVHIAWLLAGAALTAALGILGRRLEAPGRKALRRALGAALIALEATRVAALVATGVYDVYYLPLHLCGLAVFLTIAHAFSGGTLLGELLYSLCMPGAACALLFPDWTDLPAWNLLCILSFSIHILLVAYPVALFSWGELQPRAKRLPVCFALLATAAVPIYILDKAIDANFFFLNWPSPGSPLMWFAQRWGNPGYILGYLPMLAAVWLCLYLPVELRRRVKKT